MIVPGSANALLLSSSAYTIPYSLRFRASNSAYLTRTPSAADATRTKASISIWLKRGALGGRSSIYAINSAGSAGASNQITMIFDNAGSNGDNLTYNNGSVNRTSTSVYRDPSAWYNLCQIFDTTQATAADRVKTYINGVLLTDINIGQDFTLNSNTPFGQSGVTEYIGRRDSGLYYDGYMAEIVFVVGQALTPSSFGQTDATTGVWVPKQYAGTYGTNGFYLKFADATTTATIGNDSSGNGNNFTTSGISVTSGVTFDQMLDTPTLNYAVWSAIDKASVTVSEANMAAVSATDVQAIRATVAMPATGKWYWEVAVSALGYGTGLGIADNASNLVTGAASAATRTYQFGSWFNTFNSGINQFGTDQAITGGANWTGASQPAANDIIIIAVDMDNGSMWVGKNGTWFNSSGTANPATNTDPRWTGLSGTTWFPYMAGYGSTTPVTCRINFGQRAFAYTPPSGFKALNTTNLPTPSIKKGSLYMDATLRTGTGATTSVSTLGFQPDWVWIKSRSNGTAHNLFNSVIGATKGIQTTGPNAQYTDTNTLTAFNANGYSLGSDASSRGVNINTNTYVDWAWKESTTAGLDILSWTGDGTGARTINHALGVTPEFMMLRGTDARVWACWFDSMTSAAYYMDLGTAAAEAVDTTMFDSTSPTSTTFRVGSYNNVSAVTYVGYFFSSIAGFSRIGSYTGNASTDGPFVFCGFSPKFVMVKGVDIGTGWFMVNPSNSANEVVVRVFSDTTGAELSNTYGLDLLSNGFKVRAPSGYSLNNSGNKYAFIAYAENPFKYARAR